MNTVGKAGLLSDKQLKESASIMSTLNKYAKQCTKGLEVHSCTDVTGFSLMGHSYEMASGSQKTIALHTTSIPILTDALSFASMGIIPEGMYNNLDYLQEKFDTKTTVEQALMDVLFDPQTSGGLLLSMPEKDAKVYLSRMEEFTPWAKIIGDVRKQEEKHLLLY